MKTGGLIFAHNSEKLDYALLALISAGLAKKKLGIPFTLITDTSTNQWMDRSGILDLAQTVFEQIKIIDNFTTTNRRFLHDGGEGQDVPFINSSRSMAYDLSPYDRTLLIDSDYLIFSDSLKHYLNSSCPFMIPESIKLLNGHDPKVLDKYISYSGIKMCWATCIIFDKTAENKKLFDLVDHIKTNYSLYSDVYGYTNTTQFRNDIAFSISKHIIDGFGPSNIYLPPLLSSIDKDILIDASDSKLRFLIYNESGEHRYGVCSTSDMDVHIMNKQSIIRNKDKLLELI